MGFVQRKIPCQIALTDRQLSVVKDEAKRQGITVPDVVRRIIDNYIDGREHKENLKIMDFRA